MDPKHVAALSRSLMDVGSRRGVVAAVLGGTLGWLGLAETEAGKGKKKKGKNNGKKKNKSKGGSPPPPPVQRGPNAACPTTRGVVSGYAWYLYVAQTFTEPNGGRLQAASLWLRNTSATATGTYELLVNAVDPATGIPQQGTTLALAQRPVNQVSPAIFDWVRFTFPNPPQLAAGTQYALVLRTLSGSGFEGPLLEHQRPGPCAGGEFFVSNGNAAPFIRRSPSEDIAYQTEVSA